MTTVRSFQDLRLGIKTKASIVVVVLAFFILIADSYAGIFGPLLAYLYGSIPFGWMFAKARTGKDISKEGSGNLGVANSFNVAGYSEGIFTIVTEASKALLPLTISYFFFDLDLELSCVLIAGSFLGANFSLFIRFQGGMGVTIALWSMLILSPLTFIIVMVLMFVILKTVKDTYHASLLNFAIAPLILLVVDGRTPLFLLALFIAAIFFLKYRRSMDEFRLRDEMKRRRAESRQRDR
ncbi:MAG: glycerol-3-phosphate acyltransferase [Methanomassiliicoccales archaeon]|nr:MAG: glycerol-3-phosphate acyltransferase [Methanomassiliicoccales archaeon]